MTKKQYILNDSLSIKDLLCVDIKLQLDEILLRLDRIKKI